MPETAGELMKRLKHETTNPDTFSEDEVESAFVSVALETLSI